jgi:hypothetical protein
MSHGDYATSAEPPALGKQGDHYMFSFISPNITQPKGRAPSARLSRRTTPSVKIIGAAAIALFASANTFANAAENSSRLALVHHACTVVLGLHQPGGLYNTCVRSLSKTLSELDQARLVSTGRSICAQQGLKRGTPAFAVCVVNAEQSPGTPAVNGNSSDH